MRGALDVMLLLISAGPSWKQLHDFLEFSADGRRNRCLMDEGRLGAGEDQLEGGASADGRATM